MFTFLYKILLDIIFPQSIVEGKVHALTNSSLSERLHIEERHSVTSLFQYRDPLIKQMIWLLKYKKDTYVAQLFAHSLHDYLLEELSDELVFSEGIEPVIVPIPLSNKRERERGYNQIKLVTNELQRLGGISVNTHILIKKKHTTPQTSLHKKMDREKNVKDAFEVMGTLSLSCAHVILIDDVLTTGSTLREATRVLKEAGVYKVSSITLAH